MNAEVAKANLAAIGSVLDSLGVTWFFHAGTCLGAIREGGIIAHDLDTDLGVMPGTDPVPIVARLQEAGFSVEAVYGQLDDGYEMAFMRDGVKTDIFWFYAAGEYLWHSAYGENRKQLFFVFSRFSLEPCHALGFRGYVPSPTICYLLENYGDNWRKVDTEWDFMRDPPSLRAVRPATTYTEEAGLG